jgi:hypothetical protein
MTRAEGNTDHSSISFSAITSLDASVHAHLLSFYGLLGLADTYWNEVHRAFNPGPGLIVVASDGEWPPRRQEPDTIKAVLYGYPFDRNTALLSSVAIGSRDRTDVGLMAAVYHAALKCLLTLDMKNVRYEVPAYPAYYRRILNEAGFVPEKDLNTPGRAILVGSVHTVLSKLELADVSQSSLLDPGFGNSGGQGRLASFICALQLGGPRQSPGFIADLGISRFDRADSEPGTPDGGTPKARVRLDSEPGTPDGGTPKARVRSDSEPGTPDGGIKPS